MRRKGKVTFIFILNLSTTIMPTKGKMKRNKGKGGIPDAGKLPGSTVGPKHPMEFDEDSKESDKSEEDHAMDLEDYLTLIYRPSHKADLKASGLSLRELMDNKIMENNFRGRDLIFMANKIRDEVDDFMVSCEELDATRRLIWICNISHVFDEYIAPFGSRAKQAFDKASYDLFEAEISKQLERAKELISWEVKLCTGQVVSIKKTALGWVNHSTKRVLGHF